MSATLTLPKVPANTDEVDRLGKRRFSTRLAVIAAAGLVLRVVYILTVARRNPNGGDPLYYHVQANLLAAGHGFAEPFTWIQSHRIIPSAFHPPLFSVVLAASSWLGGTSFFAHKLTSCLIGTATVVVVGVTGRQMGGERAGLIAAGLAAAYPNLWVVDGIGMPETLYALTIAVVILAGFRMMAKPDWGRAAWFGLAIGLAALARGEGILLLPAVAVPLAWQAVRRGEGWAVAAKRLSLIVGMALVVIAPWTVRNLATFDRPVPISVNGEEVLATANCDLTWHGAFLGYWHFNCYQGHPPGDESDRAAHYAHQGLTYVSQHLDRAPVVAAARVGRIWDVYRPLQNAQLNTIEGRDHGVSLAGLAAYAVLMPLAIAGGVILRRRGTSIAIFVGLAAVVTTVAVYSYGATRFRMPAEVAIVLLAGVALDRIMGAAAPARPGPGQVRR